MSEPIKFVDIDASQAYAQLKAMAPENAWPEKEQKDILRKSVGVLRTGVRAAYRGVVSNDPRKSVLGVKTMNWRRGVGANASILNPRRSSGYQANVERTGGASGIRRRRRISFLSNRVSSYWGRDRAFILRFVNNGTKTRHSTYGNRGMITARNFYQAGIGAKKEEARGIIETWIKKKMDEVAKNTN